MCRRCLEPQANPGRRISSGTHLATFVHHADGPRAYRAACQNSASVQGELAFSNYALLYANSKAAAHRGSGRKWGRFSSTGEDGSAAGVDPSCLQDVA